jgi:ATP-dependent DNA helicase RecQ
LDSTNNLSGTYDSLEESLESNFGYSSFKNSQLTIIISILNKKDTVALLPTGGGKSLCYQFPTIFAKLKTVIVSPLIALMEDQLKSAKSLNIPAWSLSSLFATNENLQALNAFKDSEYGLLFISPERIKSQLFIDQLKDTKIDLIAVDEAHCVSQWGFDFRPEYKNVAYLKRYFPNIPWLVLTATATEKVMEDVFSLLQLKDPTIVRRSFIRTNIQFAVIKTSNPKEYLLRELEDTRGSIIVYCRNRLKTEDIAEFLNLNKIRAIAYHAGLLQKQKIYASEAWMNDKCQVIVSTNAFGMGIDKSDVRKVIHLDLPPSIEEYYQEAGRAGRDENLSTAIMLISENEAKSALDKQFKFIVSDNQMGQIIRQINNKFRTGITEFKNPIYEIKKETGIHPLIINQGLKILNLSGYASTSEGIQNPSRIRFDKAKAQNTIFRDKPEPSYQLADYCLKRYENLFNSWVIIDEFEIATILNQKPTDISSLLKQLQNEEILKYQPALGPRVLTIHQEIEYGEHIISRISYQYAKIEQFKKVINYCESKKCRVQYLVEYFDENTELCGKCDICVRNSKSHKMDTFDNYLYDILKENEPAINQILENKYLSKKETIRRLQYLATERRIVIKDSKIYKK